MRKILIWLLAMVIVTGCLTGCGPTGQPAQTVPATQSPETAAPTQAAAVPTETVPVQTESQAAEPVDLADTYWVGVSWYNEDTGDRAVFDPESWSLDLDVHADGTARFRDIHEGIALTDDSLLYLSWECGEDGSFTFYSDLRPEPVLRGSCENGVLTLEYHDLTVLMEERPVPQTVGTRFTPSELAGTWLLVSGETEGWVLEAMPAELDSMVIRVDSFDGPLALAADLENRDYFGFLEESQYRQEMTILPMPLYPGCENEAWCARIGGESPRDGSGNPLEPEAYVTLLDYDTMLVQTYYTFDGYPAVSYQTYWRFPRLVSWMSYESMELGYTNWTCSGYRNAEGIWGPVPEEMEYFELSLDENGYCYVFPDGETPPEGTWAMYQGGVLRLTGEDDFWFGGAVSGYYVETADGGSDVYEMTLYYAGGLLKLRMSGYG